MDLTPDTFAAYLAAARAAHVGALKLVLGTDLSIEVSFAPELPAMPDETEFVDPAAGAWKHVTPTPYPPPYLDEIPSDMETEV